ncbi:hypothetical protein EDC04DRAFT_2599653 [Pisolithus marmoratus]|nr:hypothetical protein EDC04DRAFT_2599653 [Pisolithus marmoratus]
MSRVYVTTKVQSQEFQELPEFYQKGSSTNEGKLSEKEEQKPLPGGTEPQHRDQDEGHSNPPSRLSHHSHHTPTADKSLVVVEGMGNGYDEGVRQLEDDEGDNEG